MLRLNNSTVTNTEREDGTSECFMQASFDEVTRTGRVKSKRSAMFTIRGSVLSLNGAQHQLDDPVNLIADPEDLIQYFEARFNSLQADMFLEPPQSRLSMPIPVSINDVRWEYYDMSWRAIDKGGTVAYFNQRPQLDKAGFWVASAEGVIPVYGKFICFTDGYKNSLHSISN